MMYLIPQPVATKQVSGIAESSPSRPSLSKSYHQHPEKSSASLLSYSRSPSSHRRRCHSSDEEDDSRDRQSHWKRIKTRSDDHPRESTRNLIRYTERDHHHGYERSPPRSRVQASPPSTNPRLGHRVVELKGSMQEDDAGLRRCSREAGRNRSKGWDGGTASSKDIDPGGSSKRKHKSMSTARDDDHRSSSSTMCERSMVVGEKHTARRAPVEKGYEVRVSGREGEFVHSEGAGRFLEDSRHAEDGPIPARMGSDFRHALNRRSHGGDTTSRESRGFGEHQIERGSEVPVRVRRVEFDLSLGNGKGSSTASQGSALRKVLELGRPSRSGNDEGKASLANHTAASATDIGAKEGRDMESVRRQEKRERWAEKERDLEKELESENMPKSQTKSVTIVDYSHKFTVVKAPISAAAKPVEVDPHRLCQRQKQIDYGKNTLGYERYTESVPRYQRTKAHPRTPDIRQVCSKRSWDGQIRKWRRLLHEYDPPKGEDEEDPDLMFAPTREHDRSAIDDDSPMDTQSEFVEDPDLKIYDGWSDDEC